MIAWIGYLVLRDEMPARDVPLVCFPCCKLIGLCLGSLPLAIFSICPVWLQQMANDQSHNFPKWKNAKTCQEKIICGRMGMDWTKSAKKDGQKKSKVQIWIPELLVSF